MYLSGVPRPAICAEVGRTDATITNVLRREGVTPQRKGGKANPERDARVLSMYSDGIPTLEIAASLGLHEKSVYNALYRHGVQRDRNVPFTEDERARIVELYRGGMDGPAIGRLVDCHSSGVYALLKREGIDRRERIALLNPSYFDEIDMPDKAYWLGFIAADGCVTGMERKNPRLQIKLARRDHDHLVILHRALDAQHAIRDNEQWSKGKMRPYSTLTVYSAEIVNALIGHGITPRKSLTLQPWDGPADLMPHYWRGVIDGDGSITQKGWNVWVSVVGSQPMMCAFAAWAHDACGTNATARPDRNRSWVVQVGGTIIVRGLIHALYADAPTALARKRERAERAIAWLRD